MAVAKQKERHNLIDALVFLADRFQWKYLTNCIRALLDLDKQLHAIEDGSHPSLTWMLDELERRRNLQLTRLEARYKSVYRDGPLLLPG